MSREAEVHLVGWLIETMIPMIDDPERERFCVNFDAEYIRLKKVYKDLTGKEWSVDDEY